MYCGKNLCCIDIYGYINVLLFYLQVYNMYRRNVRFRVVNMKELVGFNFIGFVFYVFFYIIDWFDNNVGYNNFV